MGECHRTHLMISLFWDSAVYITMWLLRLVNAMRFYFAHTNGGHYMSNSSKTLVPTLIDSCYWNELCGKGKNKCFTDIMLTKTWTQILIHDETRLTWIRLNQQYIYIYIYMVSWHSQIIWLKVIPLATITTIKALPSSVIVIQFHVSHARDRKDSK